MRLITCLKLVPIVGMLLGACNSTPTTPPTTVSEPPLPVASTPPFRAPIVTPAATTSPKATGTPSPSPSAVSSPTAVARDQGNRQQEISFSYVPPPGWQVRELPGLTYQVVFGAPVNNFAPNINFIDEAYSGSLDDYVAASLKTLDRVLQNLVVLSRHDVVLNNGQRAVKVVVENTQNNRRLHQVFYILQLKSNNLVVTYTRPAEVGQVNDIPVEQSIKTIRPK